MVAARGYLLQTGQKAVLLSHVVWLEKPSRDLDNRPSSSFQYSTHQHHALQLIALRLPLRWKLSSLGFFVAEPGLPLPWVLGKATADALEVRQIVQLCDVVPRLLADPAGGWVGGLAKPVQHRPSLQEELPLLCVDLVCNLWVGMSKA